MRRALAVVAALVLLGCPSRQPEPKPQASRSAPPVKARGPNVLLITIDTLRADHLGTYGYARHTSPRIDAFAAGSLVFEQAYTFWPKTRGSFVMMMTGRRPTQNGYGNEHPELLSFNPTIASVLHDAGYATHAVVDNANVAKELGYAKGFDTYRELWREDKELGDEAGRTPAITADGIDRIRKADPARPFFLWLHYINPHAPYTPPAPYDTRFVDGSVAGSRRLRVVPGLHGGIPRQWALGTHDRLGYYVAQYDGEIAFADEQVGQVLDALAASPAAARTVVILTADHGESLGEHDYFFDHGEDLFDPSLRIPLVIAGPGVTAGRTKALASTIDLLPTILDLAKVSYPPDLAGTSVASAPAGRERLYAQNDRHLSATLDARYKIVATPKDEGPLQYAFYDRQRDPAEAADALRAEPDAARVFRREMELYVDRGEREFAHLRPILQPGSKAPLSPETCANLKGNGYVDARCGP